MEINYKFVANLGDASPLDHGGFFVYEDTSEHHRDCAVLLEPMEYGTKVREYRFDLPICTLLNQSEDSLTVDPDKAVLSDNPFHPDHPAWFAKPESEKTNRPQDSTYLSKVASYNGMELDALQALFCSSNLIERATAYRMVGEYHGFDNFDSYPNTLTRKEAQKKYKKEF